MIRMSSLKNKSDLIDAKLEEHQLCGSKQCPACGHKFQSKPDWVGLPAGVKFDPTDQELIEHLEAKVESKIMKSHPLIDEFIPTIDGEDGICYTHPEKLPGVTRDGLSRHFFHRPSKAYTTGTRKRRKIQNECDQLQGAGGGGETRWHKTGKTRPVLGNGKQKGCKKILVLYTNFGKNRKPEKTNWVMHQYHLGQHEEEKEGELVVSKIFFQTQPRQCNNNNNNIVNTNNNNSNWSERSATTGEASGDQPNSNSRRESTSGSCSSKEIVTTTHRDHDVSTTVAVAVPPAPLTSTTFTALDHHQHLKSDHFSFIPFRKTFDEVGIGDASRAREVVQVSGNSSAEGGNHHHHHQQQQNITANSAFHMMSRPSHPISTIISPSPLPSHHNTSIILDDVTRLMLQNDHHFQQQHHKLEGRSASGLEELIMGCTSTNHSKEESSITHYQQEAEWLKYSSYWPDSDNPGHHHG